MKNLTINTKYSNYNIFIDENVWDLLPELTDSYDKILLLSNETIYPLYGSKVEKKIENILHFSVPDGEIFKTLETANTIYSFLIENGFSRKSLIICLGGGVICDIGGFVASTFMRGIDFMQIPTSLLAQIDASIGGKVAVNHSLGKNLIGSFKQPIAILIDPTTLSTLPKEHFLSGIGEIIKHAILDQKEEYFNFLKLNYKNICNLDSKILAEMIYRSCCIKKYFVENDEFESNIRAFLNLGHTYAHSLETALNFENIPHGIAVAKGIIFELSIAKELNYIDISFIEKIKYLFSLYSIDSTPIFIESKRLIEIMKRDKKNSNNLIKFIIKNKNGFENIPINNQTILKVNNNFKNRFFKAVIDIGSNSCRLFISEVKKNENNIFIIKPILKKLEVTRLGKNLIHSNLLSEEAITRTVSTLKSYVNIAKNYGCKEIFAFATAATREADNSKIFTSKVKNECDLEISIIPGEKEATLSFLPCISLVESEKNIFSLDIGGGSSEIVIGNSKKILFIKSFPIGVVKLTDMFFKNNNFSDIQIEKCKKFVMEFFKEISIYKNMDLEVFGVAGTVTTNVTVLEKMPIYIEEKVHKYSLSIENLKDNLSLFLSKNNLERERIIGLEKNRADVIIAGNIILISILELLNKNHIIVSTMDNLEGATLYCQA